MSASQKNLYISAEVKFYFDFWFVVITTTSLATLTLALNLVNMAVFVKHGLNKQVNFTLFCLSLSDFMAAVSLVAITEIFTGEIWLYLNIMERSFYSYLVHLFRNLFTDISTALTVFISVERSVCVVLPFQYKYTCLARQPRALIFGIVSFVVINYVPNFTFAGLGTLLTFDNSTVSNSLFTELYVTMQTYNDIAFGVILAAACQVCIFVCAVLMYQGLRQSGELTKSGHKVLKTKVNGLSGRDREIVKLILVLSILYLVSSMLQVIYCWTRAILPELARNELTNLNRVLGKVTTLMSAIYGFSSFFVYVSFNRKFRLTLWHVKLVFDQIKFK
nr:P2Y purinoceptor 2-like [Biomphalaria glabrata]